MDEIIDKILDEFAEVTTSLEDPTVSQDSAKLTQLSKKRSSLQPVIDQIHLYRNTKNTMKDNAGLINSDVDEELKELATLENIELSAQVPAIEKKLEILLLPKDPSDEKDIIVEIRAGAGGDESSLFAASLFRMYGKFAETQGWKVEVVSQSLSDVGGFKEVVFNIGASGGDPVYTLMKYESGVHRVQRVPETEKQGRIHTSTATVAVLPEAQEVDLHIDPKDLRIDTFASSGPGGQSVNTTMSAVRITHIPSGTVVSCQDGKSQHKNKDQAMKVLRSRILQKQQEERDKEMGDARKSQVGTGDRSEKIRTYNIPQDRVTDHRIKTNWSGVENILTGNIEEIITALREEDVRMLLQKQTVK